MLAHAIGDSGLQVRDHMTWFKHQMSRTDASHTFARTVAMKSMSMAVSCRLRLSRQTMQRALSSYASTCCLRHGQDSTRTTCTYSASTQKLPTPGVEAVWVCAYTSSVLDMKVALWELGAAVPFCAAFFFLMSFVGFAVRGVCWLASIWTRIRSSLSTRITTPTDRCGRAPSLRCNAPSAAGSQTEFSASARNRWRQSQSAARLHRAQPAPTSLHQCRLHSSRVAIPSPSRRSQWSRTAR